MKRSSQVGLLLMGTLAVGGGAYALMPSENCQPAQPGMTQPGTQPAQCSPRSSSSGYGYGGSTSSGSSPGSSNSSRQSFKGIDAASSSSGVHGGSGSIARGGFGSFSSHFTGGG